MLEHNTLGNVLLIQFILFYAEALGNAGAHPWKCFIDSVYIIL
jgi:hypothetical protein